MIRRLGKGSMWTTYFMQTGRLTESKYTISLRRKFIYKTMAKRKTLQEADPKAFQTMLAFEKYLSESSLSKTHAELIKIRVSQINGCSYCINKHTKEAREAGESEQRIYLLSAWREVPFYSPEERAILALAEEMTNIAAHGVSDAVYNQAVELLGQQYTTEVMMGIIAMNAWNRVGITTQREIES